MPFSKPPKFSCLRLRSCQVSEWLVQTSMNCLSSMTSKYIHGKPRRQCFWCNSVSMSNTAYTAYEKVSKSIDENFQVFTYCSLCISKNLPCWSPSSQQKMNSKVAGLRGNRFEMSEWRPPFEEVPCGRFAHESQGMLQKGCSWVRQADTDAQLQIVHWLDPSQQLGSAEIRAESGLDIGLHAAVATGLACGNI